MANRCILQIALLCFTTSALSVNYDLLRSRQRSTNSACRRILSELNGTLTKCLQQRINSIIPQEIKQPQLLQKEDVLLVTYEMLSEIFRLFDRNSSQTGWNESITEKFFSELQHQMGSLETTLKERRKERKEERKEEEVIRYKRTILRLKKYYSKLQKYLQANGYNSCAWVIVKTEISRNFFFLNKLTNYFPD